MAEDQQKEQPMERSKRGITRRDLLAGTLGAAAGVVGNELVRKLSPEREEEKDVVKKPPELEKREGTIKLPAIIGMIYQEEPVEALHNKGWGSFNPSAGEKGILNFPIGLVKINPDGTGERIATTKTDENGIYIFEGINPGIYWVSPATTETPDSKGYWRQVLHGKDNIEINLQSTVILGPILGKAK